MDIHYKKQSQFELFPGVSTESGQFPRATSFLHELKLAPENMIVVFIVLLMIFVLSFSLGVERGRHAPQTVTAPPQKIPLQIKNNAIIPPLNKPATMPTMAVKQPVMVASTTRVKSAVVNSSPVQAPVVVAPKENYNYTLQVASYKQASYAQRAANQLRISGLDAFVMTKGNFSMVCVGKFMQTSEAKKLASRLKSKYKDILIRSL